MSWVLNFWPLNLHLYFSPMKLINRLKGCLFLVLLIISTVHLLAQQGPLRWSSDGNSYYRLEQNELVQYSLPSNERKVIVTNQQLTPQGQSAPLKLAHFNFSDDGQKLLLYTNATRVWRINTRGDYWVLDMKTNQMKRLGNGRPDASLMFAKISPDGLKAAYVSEYNIYVEDLASGTIKPLTADGNRKFINGTFDWVYEEEFACRDGFRWSPDSKSILFWQIDARDTRDYYMINNTDSVYSRIIPVEYPKVGEKPSACRLGFIDVNSAKTTWINLNKDPRDHYVVRGEFIPGTNDVLIQQLNRNQNQNTIIKASLNGTTAVVFKEEDPAWVDVFTPSSSDNAYTVDYRHQFNWLANGKEFLWESEKDGWRHLYRISVDGKKQQLVTPGNFDVISLKSSDEKSGYVYFLASPSNATQKYLFRMKLDGKGRPEQVTPAEFAGTHNYTVSPNAKYAMHTFSNTATKPVSEIVSLPKHTTLAGQEEFSVKVKKAADGKPLEFFKIKTQDGVEMDGWMVKPNNFDPNKKYPVVFYVYTEPAAQEVTDSYGTGDLFLYNGDLREDGYIYLCVDNRGTPVPKGREWRKAVYRKIGQVNIHDQAMAAKEILKWSFVDPERIAVWGWSGGGAATLNLMFQYPDIFKTGIAIAAVTNLLTYDNIYQERYLGLPQENMEDYVKGSPLTYAKNLQGNLLYIHGTGDDNVHFQNAEMLVNELVKHNKQFQYMAYPNRSHGMSEGEGTYTHLGALFTTFLQKHCPPGAK